MRILGYIRVSTDKQADEGYSLEAQRQDIIRYCELYGLELIEIVSDEGVSACSLERFGMQKIFRGLESGIADGVVVAKLDRLTRSVKDLGYLLEEYFGKYVLMSVADKIDTSSASGRLVLNIVVSVSQWEREAISERTKKALNVKKGNRERTGNIPYGKRLSVDGIHIEDCDGEQKIIRKVKGLRDSGASYLEIRESGIQTRNGKPFSISSLHKMVNLTKH